MGLVLIAVAFSLTVLAIIFSIGEGIKKKDKRKLFESAFIFTLSILSFVFMLFYIFIAEVGPSEPPNTLGDYVIVGVLCVLWTIGMFFGFSYLNGRLMKLSILSQLSVSYLFVIIGMLGSISPKMNQLDGIFCIRIICTVIVTFAFIPIIIKAIKNGNTILDFKKT